MLLHAVSKLLLPPTQKVVSLACFRSTAERKLTLGVAGCSIAPHIVSSILDADLSIKATARGHPFSCCVHATLLVLSGEGDASASARPRRGRMAPTTPASAALTRTRNPHHIYKGQVEIEEAAARLTTPEAGWLIDPRTSKVLGYWDAITSLALVFTALVTPYEVAILEPSFDALFVINRVVDSIFALDIILQFLVIKEKRHTQASLGTVWVTNPRLIAADYLKGWFTLDFSTVAISALDIYTVGIGDDSGVLESLSSLKVLRILRLLKLVRLVRSSRIFKRWESQIAIDYSVLSIVKCMFTVVISSHWMACVWLMQAFLGASTPLPSWLGANGYCYEIGSATAGNPVQWQCEPHGNLYAASLYWSMMTITSVGFGDIAATFNNPSEMTICTILMLLSSLVWAQVIGTFCGVIATFNPEQNAFQAKSVEGDLVELTPFTQSSSVSSDPRSYVSRIHHSHACSG